MCVCVRGCVSEGGTRDGTVIARNGTDGSIGIDDGPRRLVATGVRTPIDFRPLKHRSLLSFSYADDIGWPQYLDLDIDSVPRRNCIEYRGG